MESASFLATMSNADPNIVNQMITLIGDLEKENQEDKETAEQTAVSSRQDADVKAQQHADRTASLNAAQKAFVSATGLKNELTTLEATQRATLEQATDALSAAQTDADKKAHSLQQISDRVANEKKAFAEVLELLDEVIVPESLVTLKRSLLSFDNANPDAVEAVKNQVIALGKAADQEVADATALSKAAQVVLDAAQSDYDVALAAHTETSGKLTEAIEDLEKKTKARDNAVTALHEAKHAMDVSERKAVADRAFANSEAVRVAEEAKALAEARELLQSLL